MKTVMFTNQGTAENNLGLEDWAVISITDFDDARIKQGWYSVHRSKFRDVDMKHPKHEREMLMTEDDATEIVDFVHSVAPHIEGLLVHCRGGVSRSAAVSKWIGEAFKLKFNHQYSMYNQHVYDQLVKANERRKLRKQQ
jgi:predicted protein tyrosine phosphatase